MSITRDSLLVAAACVSSYFVASATEPGAPAPGALALPAQGRRVPKKPDPPKTGATGVTSPKTAASTPLVYEPGSSAGASAEGLIAVTGSYGVGTSVLYVLDARSRQLAVYEARGGSTNSRRLVFVGARRIDLDLALEGYNDESEFSYGELRGRFDAGRSGAGKSPVAPETGEAARKGGRSGR